MSTTTMAAPTAPATTPGVIATVNPGGAVSTWLTPNSFEQAEKIAGLMQKMATMPAHLKDKPADCFRIVVQSAKWGMDPFAVGECTSLVHGRLCYEGKLVHAVLIAMGAISEPLDFEYEGEGPKLAIKVTGKLRRGGITKSISGTLAAWKTGSKHWESDPHSALAYRGTRQWARLYAPDALLGVITPDEADDIKTVEATIVPDPTPAKARDVEPERPPVAPPAKQPTPLPTQQQPLFTVADLQKKANEIHKDHGANGLTAIRKFMDRIQVARVADCPPEKAPEAMEILKTYERELHETGKVQ